MKPENPPAFPALERPINGEQPEQWTYNGFPGMTLRDYFAGQALAGFCANQKALSENVKECQSMAGDRMKAEMPRETLAFICYQIADAMLKVRGE